MLPALTTNAVETLLVSLGLVVVPLSMETLLAVRQATLVVTRFIVRKYGDELDNC